MESYFDVLPIELTVIVVHADETILPEIVSAYPDISEGILSEYIRTFYPQYHVMVDTITKDLSVTYRQVLDKTLDWMVSDDETFGEGLHNAKSSYIDDLKELYPFIDNITNLTGTILLYELSEKIYRYLTSINANKTFGIKLDYNAEPKSFGKYPLIFNWVCDMLYMEDFGHMIISDNLSPIHVKEILKIYYEAHE